MASDQEEAMRLESTSMFSSVIQEHLELRRRNSTLEHEMPLQKYMPDDPFENHPLFKTEEQARVEDTMDGVPSIVDEPSSLEWPVSEDSFVEPPPAAVAGAASAADDEPSDETLWARSRDFDWGD